MKKIKYILGPILLTFIMVFNFQFSAIAYGNSNSHIQLETTNSSNISNEDWKIVVDDKNDSKEFSFIQKNLESSNLADNGNFLLISGIILIILSLFGIIFFSIKLYKISNKNKYKSNKNK